MRVNRLMFVGLLALAVAVGLLGANGYFQRLPHTENAGPPRLHPPKPSAPDWPPAGHFPPAINGSEENWLSAYPSDDFKSLENRSQDDGPTRRYFPHRTQAIEMAQADEPKGKPAADKPFLPNVPAPLPMPHQAAPLAKPQSANWLRELIAQELPKASADEQRVWTEELRGLAPEMVRDILRMRKNVMTDPQSPRLGTRPPKAPEWPDESEASDPLSPPFDVVPSDAHSVASRLEPSLAAVEQARDVILNNLANAHTIGFKRSRIVLESLPYQSLREGPPEEAGAAVGLGVILAGTPMDASQGPLKKTNQPLDVAVDGLGFFQIEVDGDGRSEPIGVDLRGVAEDPSGVIRINVGPEVLYTRCGSWSLNEKGELCLAAGGKRRPILPA